MSVSDLAVLALAPELQAKLVRYASVEALRDATAPQLAAEISEAEVREVFARLDFYYDRRFRSEMLCPMFPEPAYYMEVQYLEISSDLELKLQDRYEFAYELALSRRYPLKDFLTEAEITELEFALSRFLEAYRQEEIVLEVEEEA